MVVLRAYKIPMLEIRKVIGDAKLASETKQAQKKEKERME